MLAKKICSFAVSFGLALSTLLGIENSYGADTSNPPATNLISVDYFKAAGLYVKVHTNYTHVDNFDGCQGVTIGTLTAEKIDGSNFPENTSVSVTFTDSASNPRYLSGSRFNGNSESGLKIITTTIGPLCGYSLNDYTPGFEITISVGNPFYVSTKVPVTVASLIRRVQTISHNLPAKGVVGQSIPVTFSSDASTYVAFGSRTESVCSAGIGNIGSITFKSAGICQVSYGASGNATFSTVYPTVISIPVEKSDAAADKAAADKAAALNKEMNETFIALTNNLNKYKTDIAQIFRDYPAYFNQIPELRSSLQRAIDYKIPTVASQSGIDAIRELIGGGSGSALASDFLLAQAGITKYVALENIKAKTAKKTTITCIKGKVTKKVTAVNPKCPTGYKKTA